jgi:hypothetical protein
MDWSSTSNQAPGEIDARGGGKKMSRHGVIMHCSYCGEAKHNKGGCKWLKAGLTPPNRHTEEPTHPEPTVTQVRLVDNAASSLY